MEVALVWSKASSDTFTNKKALIQVFSRWRRFVACAVSVYGIELSKKPILVEDIDHWRSNLTSVSVKLYEDILHDAVKYEFEKVETFQNKKSVRFTKMVEYLNKIKKAKENVENLI